MKLLGQAGLAGVSAEALLGMLRQVIPPAQVVHVVAGDAQGPLGVWRTWGIDAAVVIDVGAAEIDKSNDRFQNDSIQRRQAILSDAVGEATFYELNLQSESGLLDAERLKALWPGIETIEEKTVATNTLDHLLITDQTIAPQSAETKTSAPVIPDAWLFIDCIGASKVLRGGAQSLAHVNLVCAKVVADDVALDGASCHEVARSLAESGFVQVALLPGAHPQIGYGVFCRNLIEVKSQAQVRKLQVDLEDQIRKVVGSKAEIGAVKQQLAEAMETAKTLSERLAAEKNVKDQLAEKVNEYEKDKQEWCAKQRLFNEEIMKAEGQLEMVRDLLARDNGL